MELTKDEIVAIARETATQVAMTIRAYKLTYQDPKNVYEGLRESMGEELTAADWYRRRAIHAEKSGDFVTAGLYEQIAKEEEEHYLHFSDRSIKLMEV